MAEPTFLPEFLQHPWPVVEQQIAAATPRDVERALARAGRCSLADFAALISPAAAPYLAQLAELSQALTRRRFGKTIQLYIPMYLSNECQNICTYCGFSFQNRLPRKTLSLQEIDAEVRAIKAHGFEHILLLTGEAHRTVGVPYLAEALRRIGPHFSNVSLEVQPLEQSEYEQLRALGLYGVYVYQETYHQEAYKRYHPKGRKSNFEWRLETPDRLGRAGIHKIGIGALLGLDHWRVDAWFSALHLQYLERAYWRTKFSVSFPRLRPAEGVELPAGAISDRELVQLICAFRLFSENVELALSTRESPSFRDRVFPLGITAMSAGSRTEPGGYTHPAAALEQFSVSDERSPAEVAQAITQQGYDPVFKDWDGAFSTTEPNLTGLGPAA